MLRWVSAAAIAFGVCVAGSTKVRAAQPFFMGLGDLEGGDYHSEAYDLSADGSAVVGVSKSGSGQEAFYWTQTGGMVGLGYLLAVDDPDDTDPPSSYAHAVSSSGLVVGASASSLGYQAFSWTEQSGMQPLGDLSGGMFYSSASGVSDDGSVIVGSSDSELGGQACYWSSGTGPVGLGDLPGGGFYSGASGISADGKVIVGTSKSTNGFETFRWTADLGMVGLGDLAGGSFLSSPAGLSADGDVVVGTGMSSSGYEAFRWTEADGMVGLGDLPGGDFSSESEAVSADGSIIVGQSKTAPGREAFIWDSQRGMCNLQEVLSNEYGLDLAGWTLNAASGISADGMTIVGIGVNPAGDSEAWIARIPEPGTLALLGFIGFSIRRRW